MNYLPLRQCCMPHVRFKAWRLCLHSVQLLAICRYFGHRLLALLVKVQKIRRTHFANPIYYFIFSSLSLSLSSSFLTHNIQLNITTTPLWHICYRSICGLFRNSAIPEDITYYSTKVYNSASIWKISNRTSRCDHKSTLKICWPLQRQMHLPHHRLQLQKTRMTAAASLTATLTAMSGTNRKQQTI